MASLNEMKKGLIPEYEDKFKRLHKIAVELDEMELEDVKKLVLQKMAGLKMLIDHCRNA